MDFPTIHTNVWDAAAGTYASLKTNILSYIKKIQRE